jgi:hypothetical protein
MGLGIDCTLNRNTGSFASPTWDLVDTVSDVAINGQWNRAEGSTRQSPVVMGANSQLPLSISGRIRADLTNLDWEALWDAWKVQNTLIDIMVLTGPSTTNNSVGVRFEANVVNFGQPQGLGDYVFNDLSFEPTVSSNLPDSVEVATGAPVFTDF